MMLGVTKPAFTFVHVLLSLSVGTFNSIPHRPKTCVLKRCVYCQPASWR